MGPDPSTVPERRRDARVAPAGRVRMSLPTSSRPFEGRLIDVSARGLRFECGGLGPAPGANVTIEILLDDPGRPSGPPRLVLDGSGRIVWSASVAEEQHAGVCFDAPVDVRQSFPQVRVF